MSSNCKDWLTEYTASVKILFMLKFDMPYAVKIDLSWSFSFMKPLAETSVS